MLRIEYTLEELRKEKRFRILPEETDGNFIDLCSNDYLGLGGRFNEFSEEFFTNFGILPFSSSASRLLSGRQKIHSELEDYLESLYGKPALLFNSGYHANVGCISALNQSSTLFICDKLIHASVLDGLKMAGAEFKRFPHNNVVKLREFIKRALPVFRRIVVVVESIYSMDGDTSPLQEIVNLKKDFPGLLIYLDEAHAFGVRGKKGLGLAEELNLLKDIDFLIGTFGKAAASAGAFVICDPKVKSFFINQCRSFIFSTALPPINMAWSHFMVEKIIDMISERRRLNEISHYFIGKLERITGIPSCSESQIVPMITRNVEKAAFVAEYLKRIGIIALPIRRPTVPPGGERIRFSLNALLNERIIDRVTAEIDSALEIFGHEM